MKQSFLVLIAIFCFSSLNAQDSKPFLITKSQLQDYQPFNYSNLIGYLDGEIIFFSSNDEGKIIKNSKGFFKNSGNYYEQELYIVEYIPTKYLTKDETKYIYKFAYESKGGKPVLVTEIFYKSRANYQIQFYYTDHYFKLRKAKK